MIEKYGKTIDFRYINRDLNRIKVHNEHSLEVCGRFYNADSSFDGKCRICGSTDMTPFCRMNDQYSYFRCNNCNCIVMGNLPNIKEMYVDEKSANGLDHTDLSIYEKRVDMIFKPKVDWILEVCNSNGIKIDKWTDIGCGGGEFLYYLSKLHVEATGIESDPNEVRHTHNLGLNVIENYFEVSKKNKVIDDLVYDSDIVSFMNVLEHVENPASYVDYFYNHMHTGAVLVIEVPRYPSLAALANMTSTNIVYRHITPPNHLQIFSENAIEKMYGGRFEIIGKWGFGEGFTDILNNTMLNSNTDENDLYEKMMNISNDIQFIVDKNGLSDQMIFVARRL
jgi:2-polyprenyl-3-methyl-5-hydroxy-6-metoxy-1,4-benzoquinol methylase